MAEAVENGIRFPFEIFSERLVLRSPEVGDAEPLYEAVMESLAELRKWMPWAHADPSVEQTRINIEKAIEEFKTQTAFRVHLFDRNSGRIVGSSGYPRVNLDIPMLEIGYWIRTSQTGQGFCREAVRVLTGFAMESVHAQRVEIRCDADNEKSWHVAERSGFMLEGILRRDSFGCEGKVRDTRVYSMLPEEWATRSAAER